MCPVHVTSSRCPGSSLHVVLLNSSHLALACRLACTDRTAAAREAQRELGADKVVLPLELLSFPEHVKPAMLRAFGGKLLAADSATAGLLAKRWVCAK